MSRITIRELESQARHLNILTKSPQTPWTKIDGKLISNPGNYHLDEAYGGIKLVHMCSIGGGITNITTGYTTKRELSAQINAITTFLMQSEV